VVIDRGYERRRKMAGWILLGLSSFGTLGFFGGVLFVLAHFIFKYW
jgi:formate hydrogenlyase subunit 3/multisubunit Na+/H+ antiporter MnhD subunit